MAQLLFFSARDASVRIGATPAVLDAFVWRVRPRTTWLPTPSFESAGYMTRVAAFHDCTVIIQLRMPKSPNPYDTPLFIRDGLELPDVKLYLKTTSSPFWHFPVLSIEGPDHDADCEREHMITLNCLGQGTFIYPTGPVT